MLSALAALVAAGGCGGGGPPRARVGALPYPGPFTFYSAADPQHLGRHAYAGLRAGEDSEGIVYTRRAGFIDLAHVRNTADWAHYCTRRLRRAMAAREQALTFAGPDRMRVHVRFDYPAAWDDLPDGGQEAARALATRRGVWLAYEMMTWHEVITWHGYKSSGIMPEHRSAFTWDDNPSHALGVLLAAEALRRPDAEYDQAMTELLAATLMRLGAVPPAQTTAAARAVEGRWWRGGDPLRRHLAAGLADGRVEPWLVEAFSAGAEPEVFELPPRATPLPGGMRIVSVAWEPRIWEARRVLADLPATLPAGDGQVVPRRDLPALVAGVRRAMIEAAGDGVDQP